MGFQSGRRQRTTRVAFTLVELLLVVVLLGLLFSAVVFSLDSLQRGAQLEEGAGQVETLLRFARARAATTGRQVRIRFGNPDLTPVATSATRSTDSPSGSQTLSSESGMVVEWEPDPIGAPGRFELLREAASYLDQIGALVRVEGWNSPEVATTGAAGSLSGAAPGAQPAPVGATAAVQLTDTNGPSGPRPSLFFYPDGSSDFAELVVRARNEDERRSVILSLSGLTGAIHQRWESSESNGAPADGAAGSAANATAQAMSPSGGAR